MKSVKPGRGPSFMGGVASIAGILFGLLWTGMAASMGAPIFFPLFGLIFIGMGVVNAIYNFKNATGDHRYSEYDIVDSTEEPDPWNERFGPRQTTEPQSTFSGSEFSYCPYCGAQLGDGFNFCGKCGREVPDQEDYT